MGACRESIKGLTGGATGRDWDRAATAPAAPKGAASTNSGIWEARGGRKTKTNKQKNPIRLIVASCFSLFVAEANERQAKRILPGYQDVLSLPPGWKGGMMELN